jgi:hypothetical protein
MRGETRLGSAVQVDGERRRGSRRDERDGSRGKARGTQYPYQSGLLIYAVG